MVKFDIPFPYGEKHEQFESVAKMSVNSDLLVAEVGVQEYGDKENSDLLERYGLTSKDLPVLKLFIDGEPNNAIDFKDEFKADAIIRFIKMQTGIRLPLNMCLTDFDDMAQQFMDSKDTERRIEILNGAKQKANEISKDEHKKWAQIYLKIMDKLIANGESFIVNERKRIESLLDTKFTDKKKSELKGRLNILLSFKGSKASEEKNEL